MKKQAILTLFLFTLLIGSSQFALAQPPFAVTAPNTYTNPVLIIIPTKSTDWNTLGAGISVDVDYYFVDNDSGKAINIVNGNKLIDSHIKTKGKMHVRGDATALDPKKQFAVKTDKPDKKDGHFLGMENGGKHWVFNDCGQVDVTLMRNIITFNMQQKMGQYAPAWKWFEVFFCPNSSSIDNMSEILENHYRGVYLNFDKIRFEKSRVSGNYKGKHFNSENALLQLNQASDKYYSLTWDQSPAGHGEIYEPKLDDLPAPDSVYTKIDSWYTDWATDANTIYTQFVTGTDTNKTDLDSLLKIFRAKTDYTSFATYFIINEIAKDQDGYHKSTFMVKRGTKCYAGPFWDKNKSYGNLANNPDTSSFYNTSSGWLYEDNNSKNNDANQSPQWWSVMLLDKEFCKEVHRQWSNQFNTTLNPLNIGSFIQKQVTYLGVPTTESGVKYKTALERNNACWQNGHNLKMKDYTKQVKQLNTYLTSRIDWMNGNLPKLLMKSGYIPPTE